MRHFLLRALGNVNRGASNGTDPSFAVGAASLLSESGRAFFPNYLAYEHARVFRQLLVKRLAALATLVVVARWLRIIPAVGFVIGLALLFVVALLAAIYERRVRLHALRDVERLAKFTVEK
jgi:hypothetical protein